MNAKIIMAIEDEIQDTKTFQKKKRGKKKNSNN